MRIAGLPHLFRYISAKAGKKKRGRYVNANPTPFPTKKMYYGRAVYQTADRHKTYRATVENVKQNEKDQKAGLSVIKLFLDNLKSFIYYCL